MTEDSHAQAPYQCRLDWGAAGTERAVRRGDVIVLVDVLSFTSAVANAVSRGGIVYPCPESADPQALAARMRALIAVARGDVPVRGKYSLSPLTYDDMPPDTRIVLPSLNGGTCCRSSVGAAHVIAGALVNASAVARLVLRLLQDSDLSVTVIACGEHEKDRFDGSRLRFAIEDYLGAGAILSDLDLSKSPEAHVCESAFQQNSERIEELFWNCVSGRELRREGFENDVRFASRQDILDVAPILVGEGFTSSI
jgi:2-phosphosulfolactate phosphatase